MLFLRPRVAEVDVNAVHHILLAQHLQNALDVIGKDAHVVHRSLLLGKGSLDIALSQSQDVAFDVHRQKVNVGIGDCFLCHKSAFAAAQLQVQRLLPLKHLVPVSQLLFWFIYTKRAGGKLRSCPGFSSDSHTIPSSFFGYFAISSSCASVNSGIPS